MPPKTRPTAPSSSAPVGERLARIETLIESLVDRQQEQHAENVDRQEAMARETREHRHRTANALQDMTGRLAEIKSTAATQAATIADILEVKAPAAAAERSALRVLIEGVDKRVDEVEAVVKAAKMSWKVGVALLVGLGAVIGACGKIAGLLGVKL